MAADICSETKCPQGREPTSICFSDPSTITGLFRADAAANCGYFTDIVVVKSNADIKSTLTKLAKSCKSLDKMNFQGHGNDGYQETGELDSNQVQEFSAFGCLFNKDASIEFYGCSVGRGCSGDMLLYQTAKTFLKKGGTVTAPTWYSSSVVPGVIPSFSLNGKSRKLEYSPQNKTPDKWNQAGLAISSGGTINERCSDDLKNLMEEMDVAKSNAGKKQCDISQSYISEQGLSIYRLLQERLRRDPPYLQAANSETWSNLSLALERLKRQTRRYETCESPNGSIKKNINVDVNRAFR